MRKKPERQGKLLAKGGVCVESTLRDAFHLEYFSVMLEDATHELGGAAIQKATVYNVETFFGWVSTVEEFCKTVSA